MPLAPGTLLGPYELQSQIGAGGMGEVYKARDPKLDRLVAIKVLSPSLVAAGDLLARFEREAKAVAALNHPNVLGIYDFGREGEQNFAVMELLEGESLREKLKAGPLPPKKALEIAQQMAQGLAAAHTKGIIHRDIKPENIFLTREGRVKVLDFGLAKQLPGWTGGGSSQTDLLTLAAGSSPGPQTEAGIVMGTVGYMAPEQVKGDPADHRADIFAFGAVLYEMLAGRQAFRKPTAVQTMTAILEEDPPEFTNVQTPIPPGLERLTFHCLEKEPGNRFQSMHDLAYALENLSTVSAYPLPSRSETRLASPATGKPWPFLAGAIGLLALLGFVLGAMDLLHFGRPAAPPTFRRLSFLPGTLEAARFGPDGKTIYSSIRVAGGKPQLFVFHPDAVEPKPLGIPDALLLGVSATSELAFLQAPRHGSGGVYRGVLARVSGSGGAVREIQEGVTEAVWEGEGLATLSVDGESQFRLEFPVGTKLLAGDWNRRTVQHLHLSRDGARLALVDADIRVQPQIVVYDRAGHRQILLNYLGDSFGMTLTGLAWSPDGKELWLSEQQGDQTALWALSLKGRKRDLWRSAGAFQLLDVSPAGQLLLAQHQVRRGVLALQAGEAQPRDLSITGNTQACGLSAAGHQILLLESPALDGGTVMDRGYLRPVAGGPALSLGRGSPWTLSADGRWVHMGTPGLGLKDLDPTWVTALQEAGLAAQDLGNPKARSRFLLFVPTGLGRPFAIAPPPGISGFGSPYLLPDEQRIVFNASINGKAHWVLMDRKGGEPKILTKEGLAINPAGLVPLSPDGTRLIVSGNVKDWFIQPLAGGDAQPIQGILPGERVVGWSQDGAAVHLRPEVSILPVTITRLELTTGMRKMILEFMPPEPAGLLHTRGAYISPDAQAFAFSYEKKLSELYLVAGVR